MNENPTRRPAKRWTEEDNQYLRDHYGTTDIAELKAHLDRPAMLIGAQASRLGLKKQNRHLWTEEKCAYMLKHYANTPNAELGEALGHPATAIATQAKKMGLKKAPDYLQAQNAKRAMKIQQERTCKYCDRTPEQTPWNDHSRGKPYGDKCRECHQKYCNQLDRHTTRLRPAEPSRRKLRVPDHLKALEPVLNRHPDLLTILAGFPL